MSYVKTMVLAVVLVSNITNSSEAPQLLKVYDIDNLRLPRTALTQEEIRFFNSMNPDRLTSKAQVDLMHKIPTMLRTAKFARAVNVGFDGVA